MSRNLLQQALLMEKRASFNTSSIVSQFATPQGRSSQGMFDHFFGAGSNTGGYNPMGTWASQPNYGGQQQRKGFQVPFEAYGGTGLGLWGNKGNTTQGPALGPATQMGGWENQGSGQRPFSFFRNQQQSQPSFQGYTQMGGWENQRTQDILKQWVNSGGGNPMGTWASQPNYGS